MDKEICDDDENTIVEYTNDGHIALGPKFCQLNIQV